MITARNIAKSVYSASVGRRKTAVATVRLTQGSGQFTINNATATPIAAWLEPITLVGMNGNFDLSVVVRGGGMVSQGEAITLGIARALCAFDETLKPTLRKAGMLTVNARVKERKKPGLKRARKAPQWSKR